MKSEDEKKEAPRAKARPSKRPVTKKEEVPLEPSPKQPVLDQYVTLIKGAVGEQAVSESHINREAGHLPTIVIRKEDWLATARYLKRSDELSFDYLQSLAGVDYASYFEVVYVLLSMSTLQKVMIKVKAEREEASVPSVSDVWAAANWNEREIFDLFGIEFTDHPHLKRILLPDNWVGYPLRKDYEPLDKEV
ncbi:NADH-quinone oxidoreductase subunit C [Hazenella sp. IB182353]|uniref:NADH-quinone oxidoreductase subunit C n=1 Tax=Polycladospora coralii TaxID=2771432 RepID=UPI0017478C02|nr:NADH-quinone oxidoreductase subunit C [Polycladospora coralii]MBS7530650.1 NADH-quinone oxidoreductase subunit C [Polycladospora coralii]